MVTRKEDEEMAPFEGNNSKDPHNCCFHLLGQNVSTQLTVIAREPGKGGFLS